MDTTQPCLKGPPLPHMPCELLFCVQLTNFFPPHPPTHPPTLKQNKIKTHTLTDYSPQHLCPPLFLYIYSVLAEPSCGRLQPTLDLLSWHDCTFFFFSLSPYFTLAYSVLASVPLVSDATNLCLVFLWYEHRGMARMQNPLKEDAPTLDPLSLVLRVHLLFCSPPFFSYTFLSTTFLHTPCRVTQGEVRYNIEIDVGGLSANGSLPLQCCKKK